MLIIKILFVIDIDAKMTQCVLHTQCFDRSSYLHFDMTQSKVSSKDKYGSPLVEMSLWGKTTIFLSSACPGIDFFHWKRIQGRPIFENPTRLQLVCVYLLLSFLLIHVNLADQFWMVPSIFQKFNHYTINNMYDLYV